MRVMEFHEQLYVQYESDRIKTPNSKTLNSGKHLTELFQVIKELKKKEISRMENEVERSKKNERKRQDKSDVIIHFRDVYSEYVIERLKDNLNESTNYKIVQVSGNIWYYHLYIAFSF